MKRFSIIIPHRGPQWQLDRCVASVPERDDVQVIVIHDEEGLGAGWARNKGLDQAIDRYVIFADSDDFFHPCFNEFLDKIKDETADVIFFNADSIELETNKPSWRANHINYTISSTDPEWRERHLRYYFTEPWCRAISMAFIRDNGIRFSESMILNDIYFTSQVGAFARSLKAYTDKCYCVCNRSESTAKKKNDDRRLLDYTRETAKANQLFIKHHIDRHHSRMFRPMFTAFFHGRFSLARKCWKEMRNAGYSTSSLLYHLIRYPRDLMKLVIRKTKAGEWNT